MSEASDVNQLTVRVFNQIDAFREAHAGDRE